MPIIGILAGAIIIMLPFAAISALMDSGTQGAGILVCIIVLIGVGWFFYFMISNAVQDKKEGITRMTPLENMRERERIRKSFKEPYGDEAQKAVSDWAKTVKVGPRY